MKDQRLNNIVTFVNDLGTVSLDSLAEKFGVSINTIRRDVQYLANEDKIKKVYGGVTTVESSPVQYNEREVINESEKKSISKSAAALVKEGDTIFIDSGTTTVYMADYLSNRNITVVTNNLDFIIRCKKSNHIKVISTGGLLDQATNSFVDFKYNNHLQAYNIDKAFMASTGISLQNGVTHASPFENEIKKEALKVAEKVYLLIDHTKFNQHALLTYAPFSSIDYIISDSKPDAHLLKEVENNNISLILTDKDVY